MTLVLPMLMTKVLSQVSCSVIGLIDQALNCPMNDWKSLFKTLEVLKQQEESKSRKNILQMESSFMSNDLNIERWISVRVRITNTVKNLDSELSRMLDKLLSSVTRMAKTEQFYLMASSTRWWSRDNLNRFVGSEGVSHHANDGNDARSWSLPLLNMIGMSPIPFIS